MNDNVIIISLLKSIKSTIDCINKSFNVEEFNFKTFKKSAIINNSEIENLSLIKKSEFSTELFQKKSNT